MEQSIDSTRLDRLLTIVSILHIRFVKSTQSIVTALILSTLGFDQEFSFLSRADLRNNFTLS